MTRRKGDREAVSEADQLARLVEAAGVGEHRADDPAEPPQSFGPTRQVWTRRSISRREL